MTTPRWMPPAVALTICAALAATGGAAAQTATSTLSGVVTDTSSNPVAGASVAARSIATEATRRLATDKAGRYHFANLPPGEYEVRIEKDGFAPVVHRVLLTVGGATVRDVALGVGARAEEVTVVA